MIRLPEKQAINKTPQKPPAAALVPFSPCHTGDRFIRPAAKQGIYELVNRNQNLAKPSAHLLLPPH